MLTPEQLEFIKNITPEKFIETLDLSKLDDITSQEVRSFIASDEYKFIGLSDGLDEYRKVVEFVVVHFPEALGLQSNEEKASFEETDKAIEENKLLALKAKEEEKIAEEKRARQLAKEAAEEEQEIADAKELHENLMLAKKIEAKTDQDIAKDESKSSVLTELKNKVEKLTDRLDLVKEMSAEEPKNESLKDRIELISEMLDEAKSELKTAEEHKEPVLQEEFKDGGNIEKSIIGWRSDKAPAGEKFYYAFVEGEFTSTSEGNIKAKGNYYTCINNNSTHKMNADFLSTKERKRMFEKQMSELFPELPIAVIERATPHYEKGGDIGKTESFRYIDIEKVKNGLKLSLNEAGKEEVSDLRAEGKSDDDIISELFEDIQGNSEFVYVNDGREAGFGLTSAPMVLDGYHYGDEGGFETDYPESAKAYFFNKYMIVSPLEVMIEDGHVIFDDVDNYAKDGDIVEEKLKFSQLKKGDTLRRKGRSILLTVLEVDSNSATLYNDVLDDTFTVVNLSEFEKIGKYAKGGVVIPNNYDIWGLWNRDQRLHFLSDHKERIFNKLEEAFTDVETEQLAGYAILDYKDLPEKIKSLVNEHIAEGQYAKGGVVGDLEKELCKLQRDLNSSRLSTYIDGDNSEEQMARNREREVKLARFNEVLQLMRENDKKASVGSMGTGGDVVGRGWGDFKKGKRITDIKDFKIGGLYLLFSKQFNSENIILITKGDETGLNRDLVYGGFVRPNNLKQIEGEFAIWGDHLIDSEYYEIAGKQYAKGGNIDNEEGETFAEQYEKNRPLRTKATKEHYANRPQWETLQEARKSKGKYGNWIILVKLPDGTEFYSATTFKEKWVGSGDVLGMWNELTLIEKVGRSMEIGGGVSDEEGEYTPIPVYIGEKGDMGVPLDTAQRDKWVDENMDKVPERFFTDGMKAKHLKGIYYEKNKLGAYAYGDDFLKFSKGGDVVKYKLVANPSYKYQNIVNRWIEDNGGNSGKESLTYKIAVLLLSGKASEDELLKLGLDTEHSDTDDARYSRILRRLDSIDASSEHEMNWRTLNYSTIEAEKWATESLREMFILESKYAEGGDVYPVEDARKPKLNSGVILLVKDTKEEAEKYVVGKPDLIVEPIENGWAIKKYESGGDIEELVFEAKTKGGKYEIKVYKSANGRYTVKEYTNGSNRGMGGYNTKEAIELSLNKTLDGSAKIDGINYQVTKNTDGINILPIIKGEPYLSTYQLKSALGHELSYAEELMNTANEIFAIAKKNGVRASDLTLLDFSYKINEASKMSYSKDALMFAYEQMKKRNFSEGGNVDNDKVTTIVISQKAPLSSTLQFLTGKSYNDGDFKGSAKTGDTLTEISTGRKFTVLNGKEANELKIRGLQLPSEHSIKDFYEELEKGQHKAVYKYLDEGWFTGQTIDSLIQGWATGATPKQEHDLFVKLAKSRV